MKIRVANLLATKIDKTTSCHRSLIVRFKMVIILVGRKASKLIVHVNVEQCLAQNTWSSVTKVHQTRRASTVRMYCHTQKRIQGHSCGFECWWKVLQIDQHMISFKCRQNKFYIVNTLIQENRIQNFWEWRIYRVGHRNRMFLKWLVLGL